MRVLLTGDYEHTEFRECVARLSARARLDFIADLGDAANWLRHADPAPAVIVVAESRPNQFCDEDVERLHRAAPLTSLIGLLGSWCEGETRTGQPWPGVRRVYWHQFDPRSLRELLPADLQKQSPSGLPRTTSDVEMSLNQPLSTSAHGKVAVCSADRLSKEALVDACSSSGYSVIRLSEGDEHVTADVAIWDARAWSPESAAALQHIKSRVNPAPVIAILDFPRAEDDQHARAAGAAAVMSRPFLLADLLCAIEYVVARRQERAASCS